MCPQLERRGARDLAAGPNNWSSHQYHTDTGIETVNYEARLPAAIESRYSVPAQRVRISPEYLLEPAALWRSTCGMHYISVTLPHHSLARTDVGRGLQYRTMAHSWINISHRMSHVMYTIHLQQIHVSTPLDPFAAPDYQNLQHATTGVGAAAL